MPGGVPDETRSSGTRDEDPDLGHGAPSASWSNIPSMVATIVWRAAPGSTRTSSRQLGRQRRDGVPLRGNHIGGSGGTGYTTTGIVCWIEYHREEILRALTLINPI